MVAVVALLLSFRIKYTFVDETQRIGVRRRRLL
jgi:hypothetical protein